MPWLSPVCPALQAVDMPHALVSYLCRAGPQCCRDMMQAVAGIMHRLDGTDLH